MPKIVAVMPIKMNNERLPGKNTKLLGKKPLLQYQLEVLLQIRELGSINVYCSNEEICKYLPNGINFIKRPSYLDLPSSNFNQIFESFMRDTDSDIYVYAHATAPFIKAETIRECINAVLAGKHDSAFCARKIQDFLWQDGEPLNFDASNTPRTQDLKPIYRETSGVYVFTKEVYERTKRRIGKSPFIKEVSVKETIDINNPEDFKMAELFLDYN